jgi:hypothetical protein
MVTTFFGLVTASSLPNYAVRIMLGGIVAILAVLLFAAPLHKRFHYTKKTFFGMICTIVISVTAAMIFTHAALISQSSNGSLNRRTGQLAVFACGQEIAIRPHSAFSSTAGTGSYSVAPSGDMEYLGYATDTKTDATLGSFFKAIGGSISSNIATIPFGPSAKALLTNVTTLDQFSKTNNDQESYLELRSGEACTSSPSMLSIYVFTYDAETKSYVQQKIIQHPELYVLNDRKYDQRDCVVIVFGDPKEGRNLTCHGRPATTNINPAVKELTL